MKEYKDDVNLEEREPRWEVRVPSNARACSGSCSGGGGAPRCPRVSARGSGGKTELQSGFEFDVS